MARTISNDEAADKERVVVDWTCTSPFLCAGHRAQRLCGQYRPLLGDGSAEHASAQLTLHSPQLGAYSYALQFEALSSRGECTASTTGERPGTTVLRAC